ncbi:MAG TPA: molybdopterin-dependent oxidoreductase [Solirubrobacteraceae bacterium]
MDQPSTPSVTESRNPDETTAERSGLSSVKSSQRPSRHAVRPFRPEFWRSPLRGPWLTSFLGTLLIPSIAVIALTGFIDHWAHYPEFAGNDAVGPAGDIPVLFHFPTSWPSWSYAVTQGTHVTLGVIVLPLVLAKLWSVMPKLFQRPMVRSLAGALERISILGLVASVLVEFATGIFEMQDWAPWNFNFNIVHYYGAWVFGTLFVLHTCIKLPVVLRAYRERGALKPLMQSLAETRPEPPDAGGLAPINPAAPTISRRGLLAMIGGAALTIFAVQVGESVGGPFRRLALLAPRGRVFGTGPNDFPVTHTAAYAQITPTMISEDWRLTVAGARTISFGRQQLLAMPQATRTITITCTDGWSTTQRWTGVQLSALARLADASEGAVLRPGTLQPGVGAEALPPSLYNDERSLLALRVNGVDISVDHGYPARVILPNVPGGMNTKWVSELRFEAA